jgi:2-polyprenyl-3-methyl-5-hydroxy-6-metoxy-1,4-benzoquinol methylase
MPGDPVRWNHNIHYQTLLVDAVPPTATTALDVGSGDGMLSRRLRERVPSVTGIDVDAPMVTLARSHPDAGGITYVHGDFLRHPFPSESFDFIGSVATLHHMDPAAALQRMRALLRPGGSLAILGLYRQELPRDLAWAIAGAVTTRVLKRSSRRTYWETPAPKIWPPAHTLRQIEQVVRHELPGAAFRRLVLWRYLVTWQRPDVGAR